MRPLTSRLTLCIAALFFPITAFAQSGSSATAPPEIAAAYAAMNQGAEQHDPNPIFRSYTPDAIGIEPNGKTYSFRSMDKMTHDMIVNAQSSTGTTDIQKVVVQPDGVTVTLHQHAIMTNINPKTQFLDTTVIDYIERDHWVKYKGQWRINRAHTLSSSMTLNGKPFSDM